MMMLSHRINSPLSSINHSITSHDVPTFPARFSHKFVNSGRRGTMIGGMFRAVVVIFILGLVSIADAQREFRSATRFDPPAESFNSPESLRVIEDQLKRRQFPEA